MNGHGHWLWSLQQSGGFLGRRTNRIFLIIPRLCGVFTMIWVHWKGELHPAVGVIERVLILHWHVHVVGVMHFVHLLHTLVGLLVGRIWRVHRHHVLLGVGVHVIYRIVHEGVRVLRVRVVDFGGFIVVHFIGVNFDN